MISFDNTEVAFSGKKEQDLKRSYWLFKLVSNSTFVNIGRLLINFAFTLKLPIKGLIKATIFKQFCGGESIGDCAETIKNLAQYNIGTILDYSVEGKESEKEFDACASETVATIKRAKEDPSISFSVFKVSGLARFKLLKNVSQGRALQESEKLEYGRVRARVDRICGEAFRADIPIFIDAEESWIQNAIDALSNEMMQKYNREKSIVYNTYQLYRKDRLDYLKQSFESAKKENYFLGAKLVRGAYMEKERERAARKGYPSPIQESKAATDKAFDAALEFCTLHIGRINICAGTHNEQSTLYLTALMNKKGIENSDRSIYFSQLLGMSDHISYNLAKAGYKVAKYVPYGPVKEVLPYLIRRAQENTSVKGQTSRELSLIVKEQKRRKNL